MLYLHNKISLEFLERASPFITNLFLDILCFPTIENYCLFLNIVVLKHTTKETYTGLTKWHPGKAACPLVSWAELVLLDPYSGGRNHIPKLFSALYMHTMTYLWLYIYIQLHTATPTYTAHNESNKSNKTCNYIFWVQKIVVKMKIGSSVVSSLEI